MLYLGRIRKNDFSNSGELLVILTTGKYRAGVKMNTLKRHRLWDKKRWILIVGEVGMLRL